jgi:hypothetical protein
MDNCQTCNKTGTLEVSDTEEVKPGLYVPVAKRAGCAKHPPIGLMINAQGDTKLVAPAGYTISQNGVLNKA